MLVSKLPEGRTIVLKRVQLEKAPAPIVVRELGKTIVAREELLKNAPDPIVCSLLFEAKDILESAKQCWNAKSPIEEMEETKKIVSKVDAFAKQEELMCEIVLL